MNTKILILSLVLCGSDNLASFANDNKIQKRAIFAKSTQNTPVKPNLNSNNINIHPAVAKQPVKNTKLDRPKNLLPNSTNSQTKSNKTAIIKNEAVKKNSVGVKHNNILIPPPPPTPSYLPNTSYPGFAAPLTKQNVKLKLDEITLKIKHNQDNLKQQILDSQEKAERATSFSALFDEGVVSRKEYEKACKDAKHSKEKCEEYKQTLQELANENDIYTKELNLFSVKPKNAKK